MPPGESGDGRRSDEPGEGEDTKHPTQYRQESTRRHLPISLAH
jgi:hypothetical protein